MHQPTWRVKRIPGQQLILESDGTISVPPRLSNEGTFTGDVPLRLLPHEARRLYSELGEVLGVGATDGAALPHPMS
ncbi:hypothetical protein GCM10027091_58010 [Streptomyces daliensis]